MTHDIVDIRNITHLDDVQLNQIYSNITLHVHDATNYSKWCNVTGEFYFFDVFPRFRRIFDNGRTCEYGMHTPSRRIDFEVAGHLYTPNALYYKHD